MALSKFILSEIEGLGIVGENQSSLFPIIQTMNKSGDDEISKVEITLDRFEGGRAVLVVEESEFIVPKQYLPRGAKEGDIICLSMATIEAERKRREKAAKDLLNEILRGNG